MSNSDKILLATLVVLIFYTYFTLRIANESVKTNKSKFRPIILRNGNIEDWKSVLKNNKKNKALVFSVSNAVATDVEGYIVIDQKKYPLKFSYILNEDGTIGDPWYDSVGWINVNIMFGALIVEEVSKNVRKKNCINIRYKDIAGNQYESHENEDFSQTTRPLRVKIR